MSEYAIFTSESVSEGHPDKMADQISDAILDAILVDDPHARVAVETMVKTGMAVIAGEVTTSTYVDLEDVVRQVILDIGYDSSDVGFDGASCAVLNAIGKQSPDIAMGVDDTEDHEQGAGDQGLMFGYATNETEVLMPAPIYYSHRLVEKQAELRKHGTLPWLRPDAKSQVTLRYDGGKPVAIDAVVLSTGSHHMQVYWYPTGEGRPLGQFPLVWIREAERWVPRNAAFVRPPAEEDPDERAAAEEEFAEWASYLMDDRPDVQNIDMMNLAGFCRNCLSICL